MSKRLLLAFALALLAPVATVLLYDPVVEPSVDLNAKLDLPADLAVLDGWLARSEGRFDDLTPGTEKHVEWVLPAERTPISLVYLHGFSATRRETSPLVETVGANLGANLFLTRLSGHGRPGEALARATVQDWAEDGHEALQVGHALGERVVLVGVSTGATLATWMAASGAEIDALVLISPNFAPHDPAARLLLWPGRSLILKAVLGDTREWEPISELHARYWTWRYPAPALFPMMELVALSRRADLGRIQAPVWAGWSPQDQVIQSDLVRPTVEAFGSRTKRLEEVDYDQDPSHHVLAGDILSPGSTARMAGEITTFLREVLEASAEVSSEVHSEP